MIIAEFREPIYLGFWVLRVLVSWALVGIMRNNDGSKSPRSGRVNGFIPSSFRAISSYLRIVSSGASTVARSAASVASSIVDKDDDGAHDQVLWAGFDKLKIEGGISRRVLLLGYRSGFQVWDVEEVDNVRDLVSRHDGPVSFMQMVPNPSSLKNGEDKYVDSRPLLVVCADSSGGTNNFQDGFTTQTNGSIPGVHNDQGNITFLPTIIRFYSLRSQTYVHVLKFRSVIYSVRCSGRVVAISQAVQIHCLDAATLERTYTIITNPIVPGYLSAGGSVGYGPLAVGPRWMAYSGIAISDSHSGRVIPKHFTSSASFSGFPSHGSLVAHYAKESSKQLAAGIVTLGDMGYKQLSRYCSELLPDNSTLHSGDSGWKVVNCHVQDGDNVGMVVVRDIVSRSVVAQFRAHKSPISALCFDPSGTLLVTASIQGHNINVFKIMPGCFEAGKSYMHLYQLQRGLTNAVIRDISFSNDSRWIMISSSRGTSHLFYINPQGGPVNFHLPSSGVSAQNNGFSYSWTTANWAANPETQILSQNFLCAAGPPITLSAVSRIRNGSSGWRGTVSGAAAAATGRMNSFSGAIASVFHDCKGTENFGDRNSERAKFQLLVFSPSGSMIQYALRIPSGGLDLMMGLDNSPYESASDSDGKMLVEAIQKWNVCQKQNRREREESLDVYGENNGNMDSKKIYPEGLIKGNSLFNGVGEHASKFRSTGDEHHLYISEAELLMHPAQIPLWAKPGIYFQSMTVEGIESDDQNTLGGEIQIERIPTRTIEARSKDLVPVFDYLRASKDHAGVPKLEKARLSLEMSPRNGIEEATFDGHLMPPPEEIKHGGLVNNSATMNLEARLNTAVNNREKSKPEVPLKTVNSDEESLGMENHFEEKDEFD
ncbi:autophagy-related protein 18f [Punica granatum]|uniref:Uncharacterized protein n=2 Tax=Punica granatum TaxID=22663 RepID=A0A218X949_PUNGR|nr:autophagy-related protein 18f [Punica granatum]OWM81239.1 hypothetical protein CDL15_Pgr007277 [Punica granatum]PKI67645.1 hypothetical protein CRG98_011858 [Punica granatum]